MICSVKLQAPENKTLEERIVALEKERMHYNFRLSTLEETANKQFVYRFFTRKRCYIV